jgi:glycosyltransferase involved in cell wall biosynthesis
MKISIIVPTLNEEQAIEKTLRQIRDNLTAFDYELIVSDSGSPDKTVEIAKRYAQVIVDKDAHTIGAGRNSGARAAHGDYLTFIDADVFIPDPNNFFKIIIGDFEADANLLAITTNLKVSPEEASLMDNIIFGLIGWDHWFNNNVSHSGSASGEIQIIRRSAFEAVHGYKAYLVAAEDIELFRRIAKIGRTKMERRLTVYHTGRRAHQVGWARVLWEWAMNYYYVRFRNHSYSDKWEVIR